MLQLVLWSVSILYFQDEKKNKIKHVYMCVPDINSYLCNTLKCSIFFYYILTLFETEAHFFVLTFRVEYMINVKSIYILCFSIRLCHKSESTVNNFLSDIAECRIKRVTKQFWPK